MISQLKQVLVDIQNYYIHYIREVDTTASQRLQQLKLLLLLSTLIRKNATELYIYRLRNYRELEAFIEEVSAIYDKKTPLELYNTATAEPYAFLYVNLRAKDKDDM